VREARPENRRAIAKAHAIVWKAARRVAAKVSRITQPLAPLEAKLEYVRREERKQIEQIAQIPAVLRATRIMLRSIGVRLRRDPRQFANSSAASSSIEAARAFSTIIR
jgi:hypothetical protein